MIRWKPAVNAIINAMGYVVVKRDTYASLAAGARQAQTKDVLAPAAVQRKPGEDRLEAIFSFAQDIAARSIQGSVVDCGDGTPAFLAAAAAALLSCGDTSRQMVLIDVAANPTNRSEGQLWLWGGGSDLLANEPTREKPSAEGPEIPRELRATSYPSSRMVFFRKDIDYFGKADAARAIALLRFTAESYPANRTAIKRFLPLVAVGGVIFVDLQQSDKQGADFVRHLLSETRLKTSVLHTANDIHLLRRDP